MTEKLLKGRKMAIRFNSLSKFRTMATKSQNSATDLEGEVIRSFLNLEKLDPNIYRAQKKILWHPTNSRFIFGGQVVGQALVAACNTVTPQHHVHSLHCYFLKGGNTNWNILYNVDRTRDGETYSSRSIKATQDGKAIFTMQASFKTDETSIYTHQFTMPDVKGPEHYMEADDLMRQRLDSESISEVEKEYINRHLANEVPLCLRPIDPATFYRLKPGEPRRLLWTKARGKIGEDLKLHQCVAAYISDFNLLGTALQPGALRHMIKMMTSLDHSIWFHNPFRADEWLLYETVSPQCGNGRAFTLGRLWKQDGTLAMSTAQEGVLRVDPAMESKL